MSNNENPWQKAQRLFQQPARPIGPIHTRPGFDAGKGTQFGFAGGGVPGRATGGHPFFRRGIRNVNSQEGTVRVKRLGARDSYDREIYAYQLLAETGITAEMVSTDPRAKEIRTRDAGPPLDKAFPNGKVPEAVADSLFDCVAAMHAEGVAHRDLHCGNAMVRGNEVRLIDFEWSHPHHGPLSQSPDLVSGHPTPPYWSRVGARHWDDNEARTVLRFVGPMQKAHARYLDRLRAELYRVTGYLPNKNFSKQGELYQSIPWLGIEDSTAQRQTYRRAEAFGLTELVKGAPVLDLGCNLGAMSIVCAEAGAAAVTGVELDRGRVLVAKRVAAVAGVHDRVHFKAGEIMATVRELAGTPFDGVVLALAVDAHLPNANAFYEGLAAMRPETLILESNKHRTPGPIRAVLGKHFKSFEVLGNTKDEDKFGNSRLILRMRR